MFKFYERERNSPLIRPFPFYLFAVSWAAVQPSLKRSLSRPGWKERPFQLPCHQMAAGLCVILILLHRVVTHGFLWTWFRWWGRGGGFLVGEETSAPGWKIDRQPDGKDVAAQMVQLSPVSPCAGASPRLAHTQHFCLGWNDGLGQVHKSQFPCWQNESYNNTSFRGLLARINEIKPTKHLAQCMVQSKCLINWITLWPVICLGLSWFMPTMAHLFIVTELWFRHYII